MAKISVYDKQLIPGKFGLNNSPVTAIQLNQKVTQVLKQLNIEDTAKQVCMDLLENSYAGKSKFKLNKHGVSDKEINIILKDFGEITGAMYMLKSSTKYASVKFPTGNEKLIDYILVTEDGIEEKFSAKSGQGGKPSITSVMPVIKDLAGAGTLKDNYKVAAEVLALISTEQSGGLYLGPLLAAQYLSTPGYKALIQALHKKGVHSGSVAQIPTQEQLLEAVNKSGSYEECTKDYSPFFNASGYTLKQTVTRRLIETPREGKEKKWGLLHYPITAEIIKWLNTDSNYAKDLLTRAANTLSVTQIYLDLKGTDLVYTVKGFSEATFLFGSPSSMPRPTNNRIGFTMKKNPKPK